MKNNPYHKKYITEDYIIDFSDLSLTIKQNGQKISASWEVLDYLKRESWRMDKINQNKYGMEVSFNNEMPGADGLTYEDCLQDDKNISPNGWVIKKIESERFDEIISVLPAKKARILRKLYEEEKTGAEIGREEGLTKEAIYKIRKESFSKIKDALTKGELEMW